MSCMLSPWPVAGELLFRPGFLRISLPYYDSAMGNLLVLFTIERLSYDQAIHASSHGCKLLIAKEMVGASGFEPPSSWSRTMNTNSINALSGVAYGTRSPVSALFVVRNLSVARRR